MKIVLEREDRKLAKSKQMHSKNNIFWYVKL